MQGNFSKAGRNRTNIYNEAYALFRPLERIGYLLFGALPALVFMDPVKLYHLFETCSNISASSFNVQSNVIGSPCNFHNSIFWSNTPAVTKLCWQLATKWIQNPSSRSRNPEWGCSVLGLSAQFRGNINEDLEGNETYPTKPFTLTINKNGRKMNCSNRNELWFPKIEEMVKLKRLVKGPFRADYMVNVKWLNLRCNYGIWVTIWVCVAVKFYIICMTYVWPYVYLIRHLFTFPLFSQWRTHFFSIHQDPNMEILFYRLRNVQLVTWYVQSEFVATVRRIIRSRYNQIPPAHTTIPTCTETFIKLRYVGNRTGQKRYKF